MFCSKCGKEVNEQEKFCRYCGATITNSNAESNMSFDVILTNAGTNQAETTKVIRETTGMSLKEAKEIVDNAPKTLKHNLTKETAEDIKAKLTEVGADVELQHSIKTSNSTESQAEVKTEEKPKKKKSKKKTVLIVVVVLFLFLAIAGSDDNQSKNTVATSTNAVETENTTDNTVAEEEPDVMDGITEEDYIASNQERTDGENNIVEVSDVSFTGMRFNKSWSEFKNQIQQNTSNISVKWEAVKPYSNKSLTEYGMLYIKYKGSTQQPYVALQINFIVEDNTDKMIAMYCLGDKNSTYEDYKLWWAIVGLDENILVVEQKLREQLQAYSGSDGWNPEVHSCFENNIFATISYDDENMNFYIHACDDEEAKYYRENGKWRETKGQTTNDNKSFTPRDEIFDNVKVHEEDTTKNSNGTQQYYDDDYLKMIGFKKCLDEDASIKSAYNSGQFVHAEELTKNSDGSVSVHVKLYIKEAYEYSRMYGMPLSEAASADVTLTKEEATR